MRKTPQDVAASERKARAAVEPRDGRALTDPEWERIAMDLKKLFAIWVELEMRKAARDNAK